MHLPKQAHPVTRNVCHDPLKIRVEASNIKCDICTAGCSLVPGIARAACVAVCHHTVCR
jgi:hypothetical protein